MRRTRSHRVCVVYCLALCVSLSGILSIFALSVCRSHSLSFPPTQSLVCSDTEHMCMLAAHGVFFFRSFYQATTCDSVYVQHVKRWKKQTKKETERHRIERSNQKKKINKSTERQKERKRRKKKSNHSNRSYQKCSTYIQIRNTSRAIHAHVFSLK